MKNKFVGQALLDKIMNSAMNFALKGSPGMRTVLANAPSEADMCGVAIL